MGATDYTCSLAFRGTLICMVNGLKLTKDDSGELASQEFASLALRCMF